MNLVTTAASIKCGHDGKVATVPSQLWVRVSAALVLVDNDPEGRNIGGCPNIGPTMKPCAATLKVATGYSSYITIGGNAVVLDNLDGLTDGTVPGTVHYTVRTPGQSFVSADS
jgi:hypothetical protein